MQYLVALIIPCISFLFESYPRFINRYFGVDVWSRMLEAEFIRRNNHRIPMQKISSGFILEGYFNYPPVLPWLLSFIPKKTLFHIQGFIAPLFDAIQNILVFVIALQLTGRMEIAMLAQVMYATIPLAVVENSYLTPRSLGYLNFTVAFYPLFLYSLVPNPLYLVIGFVFTVFCSFTHKFATQSLLFICIFFSIFDRNIFYLVIFFSAQLVAIVLSKGYYLRILEGHIANIYFWVKNYEFRFAHQVRGLQKGRKKRDFVSFIYYLLGTFTPVILLGMNLWILLPIFFLLDAVFHFGFIPNSILMNPLFFKMAIWAVFCYIFAVMIISIKYFHPIGEGQRYLEMAFVPTAILSAVIFFALLQTNYRVFGIVFFLGMFFISIITTVIAQWIGIIRDKYRSLHADMNDVFAFIKKIKPTPRILCIPHQITTMIIYNTKADVLVDIQAGTLQNIYDVYPVLRKPIKEIAKKYNLNYLILKKYYCSMEELKLSRKSLVFETEETQVFKL